MDSRKKYKYRSTSCLNCTTSLDKSERFCHFCGQLNSNKRLTIKDFVEEFFANFYAYDSKIRNSIFSIFTKPGVLAKEFNEGKRQKYANPFRLFLSVSIILFISFNLTEESSKTNTEKTEKEATITYSNKETHKEKDSLHINLLGSQMVIGQKIKIKKTFSKDSIYTAKFIDKNLDSNLDPLIYRLITFRNFHKKHPEKTDKQCFKELGFEDEFLNQLFFKKAQTFETSDIEKEMGKYFYEKLPFLIFLSLPIITIMFWLLYYRKKLNYTEHLVFTYTFFSFMFLCMILFNIIEIISNSVATILALISFTILFPLYFYKSLRNFYQQSRWKTILKFVILNPMFVFFLTISFILMTILGIILF